MNLRLLAMNFELRIDEVASPAITRAARRCALLENASRFHGAQGEGGFFIL